MLHNIVFAIYRLISYAATPLLHQQLAKRVTLGKELDARLNERQGKSALARPQDQLIWLHAASVGESLSALPLVDMVLARGGQCLVTTGTVTSAALMEKRLPSGAFHQFVPWDHPQWVKNFLAHWQPDGVIWLESEFWPNMLLAIQQQQIPAILVNARISPRSYQKWQRAKFLLAPLLQSFMLSFAQSEKEALWLQNLGAEKVNYIGNLKYASAPLPADMAVLETIKTAIGPRPIWLLASSHQLEEAMAGRIHQQLKELYPNLLTIIAPRHPQRGAEIRSELSSMGLILSQRSQQELPNASTDIFLCDSMGEMGLWYRLSPIACIGGSLIPFGGHNPVEPSHFGAAILYGKHMFNFTAICEEMEKNGAALCMEDEATLCATLKTLLSGDTLSAKQQAAQNFAHSLSSMQQRIENAIEPFWLATGLEKKDT